MPICSAYGCHNRPDKKISGISFFRFPKNTKLRAAWIIANRRKDWVPSAKAMLCSQHFREEDIDRSSLFSVRLRNNAVPCIFEGFPSYMKTGRMEIGTKNGITTTPKATEVHSCSVDICHNTSTNVKNKESTIRFFTFPKDRVIRRAWVTKCRREDKFNPDTARICSEHFTEEDYVDALRAELMGKSAIKLKKTAIPSLLISPPKPQLGRPTTKQLDAKEWREAVIEVLAENEVAESFSQETTTTSDPDDPISMDQNVDSDPDDPTSMDQNVDSDPDDPTSMDQNVENGVSNLKNQLISSPKPQYSRPMTKQLDAKEQWKAINEVLAKYKERGSCILETTTASDACSTDDSTSIDQNVEDEVSNLKNQLKLCQKEVSNLKNQLKLCQESSQEKITSLEKSNLKLKNTIVQLISNQLKSNLSEGSKKSKTT